MKAKSFIALLLSISFGSPLQSSGASAEFFAYLQGGKHPPAMIAFNPTGYDPRPDSRAVPSDSSLRDDLHLVRCGFDGLILYGYDASLTPRILAEALRQNYRAILLGIWDPNDRREMEGTLALIARYHARLPMAISVGNEGILFKRYTLLEVKTAAAELKSRTAKFNIPIATSEPLASYSDPAILAFGDLLLPNIHPAFDRPDLSPADAALWVRARAAEIAARGARPVLVKETGLPHGGDARFTPQRQLEFWRAYRDLGMLRPAVNREGGWISFAAAFEAFDLPWKKQQSGIAIEDSWGLISTRKEPYTAFGLWCH